MDARIKTCHERIACPKCCARAEGFADVRDFMHDDEGMQTAPEPGIPVWLAVVIVVALGVAYVVLATL